MDGGGVLVAVPVDPADSHRVARVLAADQLRELRRRRHLLALDVGDLVAGRDARALGRAARVDPLHRHAAAPAEATAPAAPAAVADAHAQEAGRAGGDVAAALAGLD